MADEKKKNAENPAPVTSARPKAEELTQEEVGFAPYWNPEKGASVYAAVEQMDQADPEFPRFLMRALENVKCQRGSEEKGTLEDVTVQAGEVFSMSVYVQLAPKFAEYLSYPFQVPLIVTAKDKVKGGKGTVWLFGLDVTKTMKKKLQEARASRQLEANKANAALTA